MSSLLLRKDLAGGGAVRKGKKENCIINIKFLKIQEPEKIINSTITRDFLI